VTDESAFNETTSPESGDEAAEGQRPARPIAPPIQSRFLYVDVAALRAKQLRRGALPRLKSVAADAAGARPDLPHKAERIAMEEVRLGLVDYNLPDGRAVVEEEGEVQP
jgi:DNA-directed RNA polymerase subunit K/omega